MAEETSRFWIHLSPISVLHTRFSGTSSDSIKIAQGLCSRRPRFIQTFDITSEHEQLQDQQQPNLRMSVFEPNAQAFTTLRSAPKTIVITGGSSGIGLATAQLLSSLNPHHNLVLIDLNPPPQTFNHPPSRLLVHICNITSWESQRAGFEAAYQRFGRIDCVFVNAGIAEYKDQFFNDELDSNGMLREPDRRVLNIDMDAASDTTKLAIHYLRKNKEGGEIVLTASLAGYLASAGAPLYSAAKHGTFPSYMTW